MNNRRRIYRIAKGNFYGMGPYGYLIHKIYEQEGLTFDDVKTLKDKLYSKERWAGHKYENNIIDILKKYPVFVERGCFSTFKTQRPGPWDDPLLKYNLLKKFGTRDNLHKQKYRWTGFAFDSKYQMNKWFNDSEELEMLSKFGFNVFDELIEEKHIMFGLKQIWILK